MIHEHIAGFWSLEHVHLEHANICSRTSVFTELLHANIPNMRTCFEHALEHANICSHEHILRTCRIAVFYDTKIDSMKDFGKPFGINSPTHKCTSKYTGGDHGGGKNFEPAKPACEHGSNMVQTCFQRAGNKITQTSGSRTSN